MANSAASTEHLLVGEPMTQRPKMVPPTIIIEQSAPASPEDRRRSLNSRLEPRWNKLVPPARGISSSYDRVAALLLSWNEDSDDLMVRDEVDALEKVWKEDYNWSVFKFKIRTDVKDTPQVQTVHEVASFVKREDGRHTLLVVFYAGHGKPGRSPGDLNISGMQDYKGPESSVTWNYVECALHGTNADVLEIFDCCYAGELGRVAGETTNAFESLGASFSTTPVPGDRSFTRGLIWALQEFARLSQKFTTAELAKKIKEAPDFPKGQMLSEHTRNPSSPYRIILSALPAADSIIEAVPKPMPKADAWYLELRYEFKNEPDPSEVDRIALSVRKHIDSQPYTSGLHNVSFAGVHTYSVAHKVVQIWRKRSLSLLSPTPPPEPGLAEEANDSTCSNLPTSRLADDVGAVKCATNNFQGSTAAVVAQADVWFYFKMLMFSLRTAVGSWFERPFPGAVTLPR